MSWFVRIFTSTDRRGREWHEILAINEAPLPGEVPDYQVGLLCDRDRALKRAHDFAALHGLEVHTAEVVPFPAERGAA
jgi:hypothetical protein